MWQSEAGRGQVGGCGSSRFENVSDTPSRGHTPPSGTRLQRYSGTAWALPRPLPRYCLGTTRPLARPIPTLAPHLVGISQHQVSDTMTPSPQLHTPWWSPWSKPRAPTWYASPSASVARVSLSLLTSALTDCIR